VDKNALITLSCKFIQAGVPTLNGRVYTAEALEKACGAVRKPMLGCIGVDVSSKTKLTEVSHEVHNLRVNSNGVLIADVKILDTDKGKDLRFMFESGKELLTLNPCFDGAINNDGAVYDATIAGVNICFMPVEEEQNIKY